MAIEVGCVGVVSGFCYTVVMLHSGKIPLDSSKCYFLKILIGCAGLVMDCVANVLLMRSGKQPVNATKCTPYEKVYCFVL